MIIEHVSGYLIIIETSSSATSSPIRVVLSVCQLRFRSSAIIVIPLVKLFATFFDRVGKEIVEVAKHVIRFFPYRLIEKTYSALVNAALADTHNKIDWTTFLLTISNAAFVRSAPIRIK